MRRLRDYAAHLAEYIAGIGTARVPVTWRVLDAAAGLGEGQSARL